MKWTVLSDNRTNDSRLLTEHGLSVFLQTDRHKLLLDTGGSDVMVSNAKMLGIDLGSVDYVFISHGHNDHAGGLRHLLRQNHTAKVIVSPHALSGQFYSKRGELHSITTEWPVIDSGRVVSIDHTCCIEGDISVMAHIPHTQPLPRGNQYLFVRNDDGEYVADDFRHEMALFVDGLLFTGCAHSGLENILAACPWPVHTVVGGFHLLDAAELLAPRMSADVSGQDSGRCCQQGYQVEHLKALARRLSTHYPDTRFYTSHCTGDRVFEVMREVMGEQLLPFGCGTTVESPAH